MTQEKLEIQNQLSGINLECETLKASSEQLTHEKWELSQANADLQQRLQQVNTVFSLVINLNTVF